MVFQNLSELKAQKALTLPPSDWMIVHQQMVNAFADATLDHQWIHIDPERAKRESPFGGTIAHGFMSLSLLTKLMESMVDIKSAKMGMNYGLNKVRFPSPVRVGSRLRLHATPIDFEEFPNNGLKITFHCIIEIENQEKPACVAEWITLIFE